MLDWSETVSLAVVVMNILKGKTESLKTVLVPSSGRTLTRLVRAKGMTGTMTLYKNMSVKTAILIVPMMKIDDDLYFRKIGAFSEPSLFQNKGLRKKVAIMLFYTPESDLLKARKYRLGILCASSSMIVNEISNSSRYLQ